MKEFLKKWFGPGVLLAGILATIAIVGYGQPSTGGGTGPVAPSVPGTTQITTIINSSTFQTFITSNIWQSFFATNFYNDYFSSLSNAFITFLTDIHMSGKASINQLIVTNGFSPGFKQVYPNSQGTNFILDGAQETYAEYDGTNTANIQYITNSTTGVGVSGAAMSFKMNANSGVDLLLNVNSNWVPGHTNIWKMITTSNPGFWQTTVTNAADGNGPRWLMLSAVCSDSQFRQTNVFFDAILSP